MIYGYTLYDMHTITHTGVSGVDPVTVLRSEKGRAPDLGGVRKGTSCKMKGYGGNYNGAGPSTIIIIQGL